MPELPEVETFRRKLEKAMKNKTIKDVTVHPDKIIFGGKSPAAVKKVFLGTKIKGIHRKGKYIWFDLGQRTGPVFHLGMTGSYLITDEIPDKALRSVKLILEMSDGRFFVFKDPRRFGRIFLLENPTEKAPLLKLGPDVLTELPTLKVLKSILGHKRAPIKAVLLDQGVLSGIGNWMADEILFQSGIAPQRRTNTLTDSELKKLHSKIKSITSFAVRVGADSEKYPDTWIFHHRWGKRTGKISTGESIKNSIVGGRSTAWVPKVQK